MYLCIHKYDKLIYSVDSYIYKFLKPPKFIIRPYTIGE